MGQVQNITEEDLEIPLIQGGIKAGETVEVDDSYLDPSVYVWPPARFLVNGQPHIQPEATEAPVSPDENQE